MNLTEDSKYEWCLKYCELYGLDCVYYRDWEIAERAYEHHMKSLYGEMYDVYKNAVHSTGGNN